ncbi:MULTISPECIES: DedA family protein [Nitrosomonas]|uniref:Membrane-associated protein n=2 Tax=Nitrosomonas eutropha TaxID=916 RepID=A0ABX5MAW9_9PROT|nr:MULTISPECIES: DedA family protein [Nitrosomonas]ABI59201.1 DedA family protein [Nitrosomonas eutropha C91]MXS79255.1 DedA family protein [Nitrosomonas sp. GH22]PXV83435.1 membrane-associated protein [Nitrosomonas eutropha]SCX18304.1 membrane-associated protein [Nitrosomonas eutropha]SDW64059.1 membrane-associated protein [Nitrosomonas eutropha]
MFLIDFIIHIDSHLRELVLEYGIWVNGILFLIIFCETGLVVFPFLPGDSLLFAAGSLASIQGSQLNPHILFAGLCLAGILGDSLNYWIGQEFGLKVFTPEKFRFLKQEHLDKTHAFYLKYGGKTIIIARFIPIIRTFAPFVAGIGTMPYRTFLTYNIIGAALWVGIFVYAGFYFGQLPFIQRNFKLVIVAIIILSIIPPVIEYLKHRYGKNKPDQG